MAEHIKVMLRKGTVLTRNESPCYGIAWKSIELSCKGIELL